MSGALASFAGSGQNIIYASGLYGPSGVDLSPISSSITNGGTLVYTWIGYFRPAASGTNNFTLTSTINTTLSGQYSRGYFWIGSTAVSGYTTGNASVTALNNGTQTTPISLTAGLYYPIRIEWDMYTPSATATIAFSANGSSDVSTNIFYNTLSNGF